MSRRKRFISFERSFLSDSNDIIIFHKMFLFEFINRKINIPNFMDDRLSIINFILVRNTKFINIFGKIVGTKCPPLNRYLRHIIFLKCPPINRYLRHPSADDFWRENLSTLVSNFCLI